MRCSATFVMLAAGIVLFAACAGNQSDAESSPPEVESTAAEDFGSLSLEKIQYATIHDVIDEPATLYAGVWLEQPSTRGRRLDLVDAPVAESDLDGDGHDDMVVFLTETDGADLYLIHLAAMLNDRGSPTNRSTVLVGDHVQVLSMSADGSTIQVDLVEGGPEDASCCPTRKARRTWLLSGDTLQEREKKDTGRLSLSDLDGSWRLIQFDHRDPVPAGVRITATFRDGKLNGSSGCNDYSTSYTSSRPGEIDLGMSGATRKACPDQTIMLAESKYVSILPRVVGYGFHFGRLALPWADGEATPSLLFERHSEQGP